MYVYKTVDSVGSMTNATRLAFQKHSLKKKKSKSGTKGKIE